MVKVVCGKLVYAALTP
ncbi:hypothetical protein NX014_22855 [Vibrio vulnificus]|nr:hypothetical protein [Vibrio vulnificus]MCU8260436.1 hypothetical protein [Vibrio vulnificus]MCU8421836.1 hypothetical protein [Vibrio vulnificus]MDT8826967.1 hypothetical protein [Vibrio vulnificus]MDT8826972.1 hypothetical protein [Vibrio vulnificus]MDT8827048.1 hypothetical protein [Vibrio vulnificus]